MQQSDLDLDLDRDRDRATKFINISGCYMCEEDLIDALIAHLAEVREEGRRFGYASCYNDIIAVKTLTAD